MVLSLEGEGQDIVSKLKEGAIRSKVGLKIILAQLGKNFQALEILETYKGINYISLIEYTNKFEKLPHRVKTYSNQMSHDLTKTKIANQKQTKRLRVPFNKSYSLASLHLLVIQCYYQLRQ